MITTVAQCSTSILFPIGWSISKLLLILFSDWSRKLPVVISSACCWEELYIWYPHVSFHLYYFVYKNMIFSKNIYLIYLYSIGFSKTSYQGEPMDIINQYWSLFELQYWYIYKLNNIKRSARQSDITTNSFKLQLCHFIFRLS